MTTAENGQQSNKKEVQIKTTLRGESAKMFEYVKDYYSLRYNIELIHLLVKKKYRKIKEKEK